MKPTKNITALALLAGLGALAGSGGAVSAAAETAGCCTVAVKDFPKVGGDYGNQNYSALAQIAPANVKKLGAAWHINLEGGSKSANQQSSPVVVDGVIFVETGQGSLFAVDGATGKIKWSYKSGLSGFIRGVAVGDGKVFGVFGGNRIAAFDQKTGAQIWTKTIDRGEGGGRRGGGGGGGGGGPGGPGGPAGGPGGPGGPPPGGGDFSAPPPGGGPGGGAEIGASGGPQVNPLGGGTFNTAITYFDGNIYFGSANSQRGTAYAVNANTGEVVWQFWGTPGPGEFGNDTWGGDQWQTGGASPWMAPAIDPELGIMYWVFGNARGGSPQDGAGRPGQNLFANSIVAIDAKTGKRLWYFQSVHHDIWDMDNIMTPVLADVPVNGKMRKIVIYSGKAGMAYVLDRTTGEPVTPIIETPVPQQPEQNTWPTQPMPVGDALSPQCSTSTTSNLPTRVPPGYPYGCIYTPHMDFPVVTPNGSGGGLDWSAMSFDPQTKLAYTGLAIIPFAHYKYTGSGNNVGFRPLGEDRTGEVVAFNPATHKVVWRKPTIWGLANGNGVLTTAGGVMFIGQPDGLLLGLAVKDGKTLWQFQTGAGVHTSPAAYQVNGQEYLTVLAGGNGLPYNSPRGDDLWGFKLGGKVAQAETPPPPAQRQPIAATPVEGSAVGNTVTIGRTYSSNGVSTRESTAQNAMAPQALSVAVGTNVKFTNPTGNTNRHCATQFFEGLFSSPPLQPGQSFSYTFRKPGVYFYNDSCTSPQTTGEVIVH